MPGLTLDITLIHKREDIKKSCKNLGKINIVKENH